jgi:hypothetical protein
MNQVAKKEKSNVTLAGMFEEDANTSFSNMGSEDFALPFLRVLGQLSPETNKRDAKYVEGAEPGMIFNTVTKQLYDGEKGVNVIPSYYNENTLSGLIVVRAQVLLLRYTLPAAMSLRRQHEMQVTKIDYLMVII